MGAQAQGYIDEISSTHVTGWVCDANDAAARVTVEVAVVSPQSTRIIAQIEANQFYPALKDSAFGDAKYGFKASLPVSISAEERCHIVVRPVGSDINLSRAPEFQGFVDERSVHHVSGWVRNRFDPVLRVDVEIIIAAPEGERLIGHATADRYYAGLAQQSMGDGCYGFRFLYDAPLTEAERDLVVVRPLSDPEPLPLSPALGTKFQLLSFVAMDIVNNCNLRCPFCLFDYSNTKTTRFMSDQTFDAALRLIPHVQDGDFWLSCLHEPSLHPDFLRLIDRIPRQWRHKVMFTTNLAKRMPDSYFAALADSGVHHINISIESRTPKIFERMRKGARWPIFQENWDKLIAAWRAAPAPPRLRYITMAYQSNLAEIPELVKFLRDERLPWQVEIRHTYEMEHIAEEFQRSEYLRSADWDWLAEQLSVYPADEVLLLPPDPPVETTLPAPTTSVGSLEPTAAARESQSSVLPGKVARRPVVELPLNLEVEWDGRIIVCGQWNHPSERRLLATANLNDFSDPYLYLAALPDLPKIQGYVDEISCTHVSGWVRDLHDPAAHIPIDVVLALPEETIFLASGRADQFCEALENDPSGDAAHGFNLTLDKPIPTDLLDSLVVRPRHTNVPLDRAPRFQGFLDERSITHVRGWIRNRFNPDERVKFEVILQSVEDVHILAAGTAQAFDIHLVNRSVGDAYYGFHVTFDRTLSEQERDNVMVRIQGSGELLELSPKLVGSPMGYAKSDRG